MDRVVQCLKQIAPEAAARGVLLGAENREKAEELPLDADFKELFKAAGNPALRYWHDTGHAQIKENLGLLPHAMQLASMREFIGGLHVHDVRFPARDHSPPGSGTVDFASLKPSLKPEHIRVFEFSPNMTAEQARAGIAHIFKLWENS
jgi:sugar phosphate isomerase/epimerase